MNKSTMQMNQDQYEAVHHLDGPCIVIAPPGSGKTFTLTQRIKYLTQEAGICPESVLVITFTKAAAVQMKERYLEMTAQQDTPVTFGTIHALCFGILRNSFHYDRRALLSETQKLWMLEEIMELLQAELRQKDATAAEYEIPETKQVLEELSRMKNAGQQPKEYEAISMDKELFRRIAERYLVRCQHERKLDFDDMVLRCEEELHKHPEILKYWQERFRYILVDEFQDIDLRQYAVIRLLAEPEQNLFMVGDDDQSIYGFRGSDPSLMLSLQKDYPKLRKILLQYNYRSAEKIVAAAKCLIGHNHLRFEKEIFPTTGKKGCVRVEICESTGQQDEAICRFLQEIGADSDTAIITRTNAMLPHYAGLLSSHGIPFVCRENIRNPYEHTAACDVEAYIKLAIGEAHRAEFFRIMNKPLRYLSRYAVPSDMKDWQRILKEYYCGKPYMRHILERLFEDLQRIRQFSPFAAINYIRYGIGYEEAVGKEMLRKEDQKELAHAFQMLSELAREHDSHRGFLHELAKRRQSFEPTGEHDEKKGVVLITMHGAKGLEYDHVLLPDLNERIVPHKRAYLPEAIEEERRVLYVAMTRARNSLFMSAVNKEGNEKKEISRFLKELEAPGGIISFS